jgi:hypothetical protein
MISCQFGAPVHQFGYLEAEACFNVFKRYPGNVLDDIMEQGRGQQHGIFEIHFSGQDFGHCARMADIGRPGFSPLTGVQLRGERESFEKKGVILVGGIEAFSHTGSELGKIEKMRVFGGYRER